MATRYGAGFLGLAISLFLFPGGCTRRKPALDKMEGYFPNFVFKTHEGKEVHFYDDLLKGKVVLINFMMTACKGT